MNPAQHLLIALLRAYRWLVSPLLVALFSPQGICRYTPSCSEYAIEAVRVHGAWRGGRLAVQRLLRCHPWGDCGHDPVPPVETSPEPALPACCHRARS
jgi:uncharacterized protein